MTSKEKHKEAHVEALERLIGCGANTDIESAHLIADDVLCDLLEALGYADVVEEYHKVGKWYS